VWFKACGITASTRCRTPARQRVDAVGPLEDDGRIGSAARRPPSASTSTAAPSDGAGHLSPALVGDIRRARDTGRRQALQEEQHALPR